MDERILIESKTKFVKPLGIVSVICLLTSVISFIIWRIASTKYSAIDYDYEMRLLELTDAEKAYWHKLMQVMGYSERVFIIAGVIGLVLLLCYLYWRKMRLVLTDKRAYGQCAFGKRVDLPLDSISAVGTSFFRGIAIGTSSGRIHFSGLFNRDEIHKVLSDLLIERQEKQKREQRPAPAAPAATCGSADELRQFKQLLDEGLITQEEFDAKKKQLLGL